MYLDHIRKLVLLQHLIIKIVGAYAPLILDKIILFYDLPPLVLIMYSKL
jgi:hypothetical protein